MRPTQFLEKWRPGGPWILTAIAVDQKGIDTATFRDSAEVEEWLRRFADRNHYFHVNPCRRDLQRKADRRDVAELAWLHVDVDARAGEPLGSELRRIRALFDDPPCPRPTCLVLSGGGYQAFWRLAEPVPISDPDEAARYNLQLELLFGADACHNVDRIMRLPGTVNWPNRRKREKGREKAVAEVTWFDDVAYPISAFTPAAPVQMEGMPDDVPPPPGNVRRLDDVHELDRHAKDGPVPDWCKVLIVQGNRPDDEDPYPSRSEALFACVCELTRREVPSDVIYATITDPDFGISASVLEKGSNVERYALRQINRARDHAEDPRLLEFNDRYAVVRNAGGKCRIAEEVDGDLTLLSFGDFRNGWCNRFVEVVESGKDKPRVKQVPVGDWWLRHPRRRQYDSITFSPGSSEPGRYNLWRGFGCDAIPGDCDPYLDHALRNICSGDRGLYDYLIRWMARAVQRPGDAGRTAVVLRGKQGTGKSFFVEEFGRLFGRHFLAVSNSKHLVGHFNAHLESCVVLFGDEAFYAGDRRHESVLKTLITESHLTIERKGVDVKVAPNCVHLMMASNEDWVVPAGVDDRRFFVLDVGEERTRDHAYFGALAERMRSGGREALLHHLLSLDLSGFDVRAVPATDALRTQKELSLPPALDWWLGKLRDGRLLPGHDGWVAEVPTYDLAHDFAAEVRGRGSSGTRANSTALGRLLRRVLGEEVRNVQRRSPIEAPGPDGRPVLVRKPRYYVIPDLFDCRQRWEELFFSVAWPSEAAEKEDAECF